MHIRLHLWLTVLLLGASGGLWAQVFTSAGPLVNNAGQAIAGQIAVCTTKPAGTNPPDCGAYVATYTDVTRGTPCTISAATLGPVSGVGCTNPGKTDSRGNYAIYAAPPIFAFLEFYGYGIVTQSYPLFIGGTGNGNGSVTTTGSPAVNNLAMFSGATSVTNALASLTTGYLNWTGSAWALTAIAAGGVTSFNSRTGAVVPATNDYNFNQLAGTATLGQLPAINFTNLVGNIAVSQMNSGTGANAGTFWAGDSTWKSTGSVSGSTVSNQAPIGNVSATGASPQAIYSYTLPGNTLSTTGGIRISCNLEIDLGTGHANGCISMGISGVDLAEACTPSGSPTAATWVANGWYEFWNNGSTAVNYDLGEGHLTNNAASPKTSVYIAGNKTIALTVDTTVSTVFICGVDSTSSGDTIRTGRMTVERLAP